MRIAVFQHVACEPAGAYLPVLEKYAEVDTFLLSADGVPAVDAYDAIVTMGGPMGAYDTAEHPWLVDEIDALRQAVTTGRAVWGVCLGAQLLAAACGAAVSLGPRPEVGVGTVELTPAASNDPVLGGLPGRFEVLHWHQDTFDLPKGAVRLAGSHTYANQSFRYGRSYGLQFHIEASWDLARSWLELSAYRSSLDATGGPGAEARLQTDLSAAEAAMGETAETIVARWLELLAA
jgi:GMP synthase (glutamine-hydrolysing)